MPQITRNQWIGIIVAVVVVVLAFSSTFYFNNQSPQTSMQNNTNATSSASSTELVIQDVKVGTGDAAVTGDKVTVNYVGTLTNGTKFDSSIDRAQPFTFALGAGQVIQGWDQGIAGMKVGGERILTIPPSLGYGNQAVGGVIPANATLVFDVTMLGINK